MARGNSTPGYPDCALVARHDSAESSGKQERRNCNQDDGCASMFS